MDEVLAFTEKGRETALGVISAICHGYNLDQAAALNDLPDADSVKAIMLMVASEAGLIGPIEA